MNTPLFLTLSRKLSPNWVEAFPDAELQVGLPKQFDRFNESIIYLDFAGLDESKKEQWLTAAIATKRKVAILTLTPENEEGLTVIQKGAVAYGHSLATAAQLREMNLVAKHGGLWVGSNLLKDILTSLGDQNQERPIHKPEVEQTSPEDESGIDSILSQLSKREIMVASEVARGASNLEISVNLSITERTVKAHITSIFGKLQVRNRVELALLLHNVRVSDGSSDIQSKNLTL